MNRAGWQGSRRAPNSVEDEGRYDPRGLRLRSSSATVPRDARSITNDGASNFLFFPIPKFCSDHAQNAGRASTALRGAFPTTPPASSGAPRGRPRLRQSIIFGPKIPQSQPGAALPD